MLLTSEVSRLPIIPFYRVLSALQDGEKIGRKLMEIFFAFPQPTLSPKQDARISVAIAAATGADAEVPENSSNASRHGENAGRRKERRTGRDASDRLYISFSDWKNQTSGEIVTPRSSRRIQRTTGG